MNAIISWEHAAQCSRFVRVELDAHTQALASAKSADGIKAAKESARDFVRFITNARILEILMASNATAGLLADPFRLKQDLAQLRSDCHPCAERPVIPRSEDWAALQLETEQLRDKVVAICAQWERPVRK